MTGAASKRPDCISYPRRLAIAIFRFLPLLLNNFVWCKINNLPLVRLIILQPED